MAAPLREQRLKVLLNPLADVALLVWGTHIVRTGILRIWGSDLRRFLRGRVNRYAAFAAGSASRR
jgi:phosphate:Na+ symporter